MRRIEENFFAQAVKTPDLLAVKDLYGSYTYRELSFAAQSAAGKLSSRGLSEGARVALYCGNCCGYVAALYGVLKSGAVVVPVHPGWPKGRIEALLESSSPSLVVVDSGRVATAAGALGHRTCTLEDLFSGELLPPMEKCENPATSEVAALLYTSASTGSPKGVVGTHRAMTFASKAIGRELGYKESDSILCGLPFAFDYGLYQIFLAHSVGAALVMRDGFAFPPEIPKILKEECITVFPLVPALSSLLVRSRLLARVDLPRLRMITSTGDIFPPSLIGRLKEILPEVEVRPMYGLTECKRVSILGDGEIESRPGSVGLPLPSTRVKIIREDGERAAPGERGVLHVTGDHLMGGYWEDAEATSRRWKRDSEGVPWLDTGDIFTMDRDGYLYFSGRSESLVKVRGVRVSLTEIENFLLGVDGVSQAAAVAISNPLQEDEIHVCISVESEGAIGEEDLRRLCRLNLPPPWRPEKYHLTRTPLPATGYGKVDRKEVKRIVLEKD